MRKLATQFRWRHAAFGFVAAIAAVAALTAGSPAANAAETVTLQIGGGRAGISPELFIPDKAYVHQGDTVVWKNPYEEPHTLTYLLPGVAFPEFEAPANVEAAASFNGTQAFTSGFILKDMSFSVKFASLGAYTFICLIHPGMQVEVTVVPTGTVLPAQSGTSPENVATLEAAIAAGEAAGAAVKVPAPVTDSTGRTTHTVVSGPSVPFKGSTVDVMRFYNARIEIGVDDTVVWKTDTGIPHTVTFFPASGPPADINPFVPVAVDNPFYDGSNYVNSGLLSVAPLFGGVTSFKLTFTKAGTYAYVCLLHADQGMAGVVVVGPGAVAGAGGGGVITPPSTGDGGLVGAGQGAWLSYLGLLLLIGGLTAGTVAVRRR
jgi:plastocyanin